jgi:hypothetical protein
VFGIEYLHVKGEEETKEVGENCIMRNFIICTLHPILYKWATQGK